MVMTNDVTAPWEEPGQRPIPLHQTSLWLLVGLEPGIPASPDLMGRPIDWVQTYLAEKGEPPSW